MKKVSDYTGILIALLSFITIAECRAQTIEIDSLVGLLNSSTNHEKIFLNQKIADNYYYSNYDSSIYYAQEALKFAVETNDNESVTKAILLLAKLNNSIGNYNLSLELFNKAKNLCIKNSDYELLANVYLELTRYYNSKFNFFKVLETLDSALKIVNEHSIDNLKPYTLNYISTVHININDIPSAIYYANTASDMAKTINEPEVIVNNLHTKAKISSIENNKSQALYLLRKSLAISKINKQRGLAQLSYRRLASYYIDIYKYDTAILYIDSSLVLCKQLGYKIEESALITYKAHIEWMKKDFRTALKYNLEALQIRENTGHKSSISSSLLNIGGNYTKLGDYNKAQEYIEEGLQIAEEQKILLFITRGYEKLSELYKLKENYKDALYYSDLKTRYQDSVNHIRSNEKVILYSNLYELEKEKRLIDSIKLKKKTNEVIFLIVATVLALISVILLFWYNYSRKKSVKEIVKLSKIIETTDQAVIISNQSGNLLYVNNGLVKMLGYSDKKELPGKNITSFTNKKGKYLLSNDIWPSIATSGRWKGEIMLQKQDKDYIIADITCSSIKGKSEDSDIFFGIFTDITRRKKGEAELKENREHLKKTIETQDKIFSIIAHDLIGPFNTILGFSELLANDYDKYVKEDHLKFSKIINKSSKNTFDLLTNLLHWSRSQMGKIEIHKKSIVLNDLVKEINELLNQNLNNKEIIFSNNINDTYRIYADSSTISTVIRNLMSNAIKFTPRNGKISISAIHDTGRTIITISDNGVGILPENINKLFSVTTNNSNPGTENEVGTGLGLVLCKELIELNGGEISVNSEIGKGTSFLLTLPDN